MQDRIFVSIAVSAPERLAPLPGALNAALRMAAWAKANDYHVLTITDAPGFDGRPRSVTIKRIREELESAIEVVQTCSTLARIVVFFAGHGGSQGPNEIFWLLSRWWTRPTESIHLMGLERMLRFYGPRQVALIGDACQVYGDDMVDVSGSPVLDRRDEEPELFEFDQFFAADVTERAFMIPADNDNESFCIFTEVMLDALRGHAADAYEPDGVGGRIVTSGSLTRHLIREIPLEAGRYDLTMKAWSRPGFHSDRVYARFPGVAGTIQPAETPPIGPVVDDLVRIACEGAERRERAARRNERRDRMRAELDDAQRQSLAFATGHGSRGLEVVGLQVDGVDAVGGTVVQIDEHRYEVIGNDHYRSVDIVLRSGDALLYACAIPGHVTVVQGTEEGPIVLQRPIWWKETQSELVADLLARLQVGGLDAGDAGDLAAASRNSKHANPVLGCIAAYLYASVGDVDGVRSVAAYYSLRAEAVPLDVALLANSPIRDADGLLSFDVPEVDARDPRTPVEAAHPFTFEATPGFQDVPIAGRLPWLRAGWRLLASTPVDPSAVRWREEVGALSGYLRRGGFTALDAAAADRLRRTIATDETEPYA